MMTEGDEDLHNPGCTCFDESSTNSEDESDPEDGQPEPKRQRRSSSMPPDEGEKEEETLDKQRLNFDLGDYVTDGENVVEAVENAEIERAIEASKKETPVDAPPPPVPPPVAPAAQGRVRPANDTTFNASSRRWSRGRESLDGVLSDPFFSSESDSSDLFDEGVLNQLPPISGLFTSDTSSTDEEFFRLLPSSRPMTVRAAPVAAAASNDDSRVYDIEFEIASIPESELNPNPIENADSSSCDDYQADIEADEHVEANNVTPEGDEFADHESDFSKDSEKDGFHSDPELEKDKWPCHKCKALTTAVSRYCLRCFQARRNWLPDRPRSRRCRRPNQTEPSGSAHPNESDPESALGNTGPFSPQLNSSPTTEPQTSDQTILAAGPSSAHNSFQSLTPPHSTQNSQASTYELPVAALSSPSKYISPTKRPPTVRASSTPKGKSETMCNICLVREKDAAFVHNKIAHRYTCFYCADRILKKSGKCPICRAKILRVVRIISV